VQNLSNVQPPARILAFWTARGASDTTPADPTMEAGMAGEETGDVDRVMASVRELNEQILEAGRSAGLEFLEAYERTLRSFADTQESLADASQSDWLTHLMKAQATFTREVAGAMTEAARGTLKR
jgi:hypothetical protein